MTPTRLALLLLGVVGFAGTATGHGFLGRDGNGGRGGIVAGKEGHGRTSKEAGNGVRSDGTQSGGGIVDGQGVGNG